MTEVTIDASQFAETIRNSVAVIEHVWEQAGVLKELLDEKLPGALKRVKPLGIVCVQPARNESYQFNEEDGDLGVAWMWRYDLADHVSARKAERNVGHLYMLVRIAPGPGVHMDDFVPHLAVFLDHPEAEVAGRWEIDDEATDIGAWKDEEPLELPASPAAALCVAEYYDRDDLENCGAAMFVALSSIDSTNLDVTIVAPAVSLVEHCRKLWFSNAAEDLGESDRQRTRRP